jgi:hypothetical protein
VRRQKSELDKAEETLLTDLKTEMADELSAAPDNKIKVGDYIVHRINQVRSVLKKDSLLELGIDPAIIDQATKKTDYATYKIIEA